MKFEQIVKVTPAFDRRHADPDKNYGIGACRIIFILKGERGAVQFMIGTNWLLPDLQHDPKLTDAERSMQDRFGLIQPRGWDVGYHSKTARYEGQPKRDCDLFESGSCFYDGSMLLAEEWVPEFLAGGTDWLWPRLESLYHDTFAKTHDHHPPIRSPDSGHHRRGHLRRMGRAVAIGEGKRGIREDSRAERIVARLGRRCGRNLAALVGRFRQLLAWAGWRLVR